MQPVMVRCSPVRALERQALVIAPDYRAWSLAASRPRCLNAPRGGYS